MMIDIRALASTSSPRVQRMAALIGVALTALTAWTLILPFTFAHDSWTFSWDSAAYVEAAQSLSEGRGLNHRVIHGLGAETWEAMTLWPPGYPVMVSFVMLFGFSAPAACLVVSAVSAASSIVLLSVIALRFLDWRIALPLVTAIAISPTFHTISAQCLSDSAHYFWVLASVACVLEWSRGENRSVRWMFAAGLCAGAAWATRNAALALFAATFVFLLLQLATKPLKDVARIAWIWAWGAAVCIAPLVVRNLLQFGALNPYDMPPSQIGLMENVRAAIIVVLRDMTTFEQAAVFVADKLKWLATAGFVLAALSVWFLHRRKLWAKLTDFVLRHRALIFVLAYAVAYAGLVIIARTRYQWGEEISSRYMVQIYWALWLCVAVWGATLLIQLKIKPRARLAIMAAVFVVVAALNYRDQHWRLVSPPVQAAMTETDHILAESCAVLGQDVRADQIVLAMRADLWRIHCDLNARKLPGARTTDALRRLLRPEEMIEAAQNGLLWGIIIEDEALARSGFYGPHIKSLVEKPQDHPEFARRDLGGGVYALRYVGSVE